MASFVKKYLLLFFFLGNVFYIQGDDLKIVSPGTSSASLYAGKIISKTYDSGITIDYVVNQDGATLSVISGNANEAPVLIIPSEVEALDSYFFVTDIRDHAFSASRDADSLSPMKGVKSLIISEGILTSGNYCFSDAVELEYVSLPGSLVNLSEGMFANDVSLKKIFIPINSSVRELGNDVFLNCKSLESINIRVEH